MKKGIFIVIYSQNYIFYALALSVKEDKILQTFVLRIEFNQYQNTDTNSDIQGCLLFLLIPILGDCSIPIPILITDTQYVYKIIPITNTQYDTDSYGLFTDITLNIGQF